jgi:L-fuconolactonase
MTPVAEHPLRLIDAHVHLWDLSAHPWYPAMQDPEIARSWAALGDVSRMARDFLLADYRADAAGFQVEGLVHVSATSGDRRYLEEAVWIDRVLDEAALPAGMIGSVEPTLSARQIEADLETQASSARFRGVRVLSGLQADSAAADTICRWLTERELTLDLVARPGEAADFTRLLDRHPDLRVVLEHAGWPDGTDADAHATWRAAIGAFAENPQVSCKLSGLGMVTHSLASDAIGPWIVDCLVVFGASRCMFASNFPVDRMYGGFDELASSVLAATAGLSATERDAVFAGNARRVYRL